MCVCVCVAVYEVERLKALLQAEKNKSLMLGVTISSLKQDKELLQQELTKKAELICEFLQDQLRPGTHLNTHTLLCKKGKIVTCCCATSKTA